MTRVAARLLVLVLALAGCPRVAMAQDLGERVAEAVARDDLDAAEAELRAIWSAEEVDLAELFEGIDAAGKFLPHREGLRHAASFAARIVDERPTGREVWENSWALANRLRHQVVDEVELEGGTRLIEALSRALPDNSGFAFDLAYLHFRAGEPARARELFEVVERKYPGQTHAAYHLASLAEDRGEPERALEWYRHLIDLADESGDPARLERELYAHESRTRLLSFILGRHDEAERTADQWERAIEAAPAGEARDRSEAQLNWERDEIQRRKRQRDDIQRLRAEVDRKNTWILGGWVLFLGGGLLFLRRRGWV